MTGRTHKMIRRYGQFTDLFADSVHKDDEYAFLQFSLYADFNQLWHWNTKELFVYLTVEYQTKRYVPLPYYYID